MIRRCALTAASALLLTVAAAPVPAAAGQKTTAATLPGSAKAVPDDQVCLQHIRSEERAHRIPSGLLAAIGLTESGRSIKGGHRAVWPWTVNAAGDGRHFESKADAIAFVEGKLAEGVESIDVGCMQINLKHHPDAFASLEDAFDPAINAAYGADFLTALHGELKGWMAAARRYHSATPEKGEAYGERVVANWSGPAKETEVKAATAPRDEAQGPVPPEMYVATTTGFLRAKPVRSVTGGNLSLFAQFYTPATLTQAQPIGASPPMPAATDRLQQEPKQTVAKSRTGQLIATQKAFQRKVAPGQTGLTLQDYRTN